MRAAALLALISAVALAHGALPRTLSAVQAPERPDTWWVPTTFGGLITRDRGATWDWVCEEAIGYGANQRPAFQLSASGAAFATSLKGLYVSRDEGCTWAPVPAFEATGASDVQRVGTTLFVTTARYPATNGVFRSSDDGRSFTPTQASSPTLFFTSLRSAPSRPQRLVVGAWWFEPTATMALAISDDGGDTFTTTDVTARAPFAGQLVVHAIDPVRPERFFASVVRSEAPRDAVLLRTDDGGATFTQVLASAEPFNSLVFAADGSVYAASGDRLLRAPDAAAPFVLLSSPQRNACVARAGEALLVCGVPELDGFALATGAGQPFRGTLRWSGIRGPLACPAGSTVNTVCEPLWPVVQASFPIELPDAGAPEADAGSLPAPAPRPCGCAVGQGPWLGLALLLAGRNRRRTSR